MQDAIQTKTGVYIMTGSLDGQPLIKVGKTAAGVCGRRDQLNVECYGGISNWKIWGWYGLDNSRLTSAVEKIFLDAIEQFNVQLPNGSGGLATEIFDLPPQQAKAILLAELGRIDGFIKLKAESVDTAESESYLPAFLGTLAVCVLVCLPYLIQEVQ